MIDSTSEHFYRPQPLAPRPLPSTQGGMDQAARRMKVTYRDQHRSQLFPEGRCWWGWAEIPANPMEAPGVVGGLTPGHHEHPFGAPNNPTFERWEAPWYPQEKYFDYDHRKLTVRIRYDKMIADYTAKAQEYFQAANELAAGNGWDAPKMGTALHPRYIALIGRPPQSIKIPQAAQGGDRWLLGFETEPNEMLVKLLKETGYGDRRVTFMDDDEQSGGLATPSEVLTMTQAQIAELVAQAVAAELAKREGKRGASSDALAKAREAKAAKKAQAEASASV